LTLLLLIVLTPTTTTWKQDTNYLNLIVTILRTIMSNCQSDSMAALSRFSLTVRHIIG